MTTKVGTGYYSAPEIESTFYDSKVDAWSMGVILLHMCTGRPTTTHTHEFVRYFKSKNQDKNIELNEKYKVYEYLLNSLV